MRQYGLETVRSRRTATTRSMGGRQLPHSREPRR
jgi:hypothetical protein